ncbi:TetR/AcrR family transcriptional regulator [Tsukamurella soli]|uniref:TetR family transcriptional regulator n=1 Tax=Tsukamurella soli TaxID=644556 RepID=A0ABP8J1M8_9ACTN
MVYDSAATRSRLIDAAYAEFSERGFAGARVDRIAAEAGANKQAIYLYFDSKEGLFDAMLGSRLGALADLVPFTPDDLPGYIAALFDHLVEHPELVRLTQWKFLERPAAAWQEYQSQTDKVRELAESVGVTETRGMDILMLCLAMAQAWTTTGGSIRDSDGPGQERLKQHREALLIAVTAAADALAKHPGRST